MRVLSEYKGEFEMNFRDLIKRSEKSDKVFDELEDVMAEALGENLLVENVPSLDDGPPIDVEPGDPDQDYLLSELDLQPEDEAPETAPQPYQENLPALRSEGGRRLTSHTQNRLAALASYDDLYRDAQEHLREINDKLSDVVTSHHLAREFFNTVHADIQRANELELANANLAADGRRMGDVIADVTRRLHEREAALELVQGREAALHQERESLRAQLSSARLELVEAENVIARNETELGNIIKTLSTRTVEAERRLRENELLREKHVNLSLDLDGTLKREAEARRKLDEVSTIHANDTARHADTLAALAKSEQEVLRLQKVAEAAHARHVDAVDAARIAAQERDAEVQRMAAEMRGLKAEIQAMQARLDAATRAHADGANEGARLRTQLADAIADKQVAEEKVATLRREAQADKQNLSAASADFSQLSLQQASEQMELDIHRQENEALRAEIAQLRERVEMLLPFEQHYRLSNAAEQNDNIGAGEAAEDEAEAAPLSARRTLDRRRAG